MPFTASEISEAQKTTLDFYLKNNPIDQIAVDRPIMNALMAGKREFPGAKQYVVEQIRYRYQSNFQWINGSQEVTYNRRQTIEQSQYQWRTAHDGYAIDEDRLAQNGITMLDDRKGGNATDAELVQLSNLLEEQNISLKAGFEEKFSAYLCLDGSSSTDAVTGLDALVSLTPGSGTVGGIDASANSWWRNGVSTSLSSSTLLAAMETQWRACVKNGGRPKKIFAGASMIDAYIAALDAAGRQITYAGGQKRDIDGGIGNMTFKGVPIEWCPEFDDNFGGLDSPATGWTKRMYFVNTDHLKLRPMSGHDMITRKPPRAYNRYEYYCAITWRGALTTNRRNAHAVLALS